MNQKWALTSRRLTQTWLDRITSLGSKRQCYAAVTPDLALTEADAADALSQAGVNLGPLHGIPYGFKDLFDPRDAVTGWGAEPCRNRVPDAGAAIVTGFGRLGRCFLAR
jgi:Asp-tRNA(Asn)/Glu-tRNA(Gln) amidotransferase A subunit family amidase